MAQPIAWSNSQVPITDLRAADYNPRKASKKQLSEINDSISRFNLADPLVVNSDMTLIGGHQRLKVLQERGVKTVPVRVPNRKLNKAEEKELNLRLNKNTGEFDFDLLGTGDFPREMLASVGFSPDELGRIFDTDTHEDDFDAQKEYDRISKPQAKPGEVYQLGKHRLMCADSTKTSSWDCLMDGKKGDLVFTDPPYNVKYDFSGAHVKSATHKKDKTNGHNDGLKDDVFTVFLSHVFNALQDHTADHASFYCWHASKTAHLFREALVRSGWDIKQTVIWLKNNCSYSFGYDYLWITEPCFFGWKAGQSHYVNKQFKNDRKNILLLSKLDFEEHLDVLYSKRDTIKDYIHPTQKPIALAERALKKHTLPDNIVLDAFAGSGSTLMACQQLGRTSYSMELDPKFVDVILKRWTQSTNIKPLLI